MVEGRILKICQPDALLLAVDELVVLVIGVHELSDQLSDDKSGFIFVGVSDDAR